MRRGRERERERDGKREKVVGNCKIIIRQMENRKTGKEIRIIVRVSIFLKRDSYEIISFCDITTKYIL